MKGFGKTMDSLYIATAVFIVLFHVVTSCGPTGGPTDEPPGSDGTYGKDPEDDLDDQETSTSGGLAKSYLQLKGFTESGNIICFIGYALIVICNVVTRCGPSTGGPTGLDGTYVKPPGSDGTYGVKPHNIPELSRIDVRARRAVQDYQERPTPKVMFRVFDEDKNGNIDACEWMEAGMTTNVRDFVKILDEVDKDKDNVISIHEFEALHVGWKYGKIDAGTSSDEED